MLDYEMLGDWQRWVVVAGIPVVSVLGDRASCESKQTLKVPANFSLLYSASYASMLSSGTQAADFIKVLYPTLKAANMSHIAITCCDSTGWNDAGSKVSQLKAAGVENQLGVITSHTYTSNFNGPLKTSLKVWQTEYSDLNGGWTTAW